MNHFRNVAAIPGGSYGRPRLIAVDGQKAPVAKIPAAYVLALSVIVPFVVTAAVWQALPRWRRYGWHHAAATDLSRLHRAPPGRRHFWPLAIMGSSQVERSRRRCRCGIGTHECVVGIAGLQHLQNTGTNVRPNRVTAALVIEGIYPVRAIRSTPIATSVPPYGAGSSSKQS